MLALGFVTVFTLSFIVMERETEIKMQQYINGVSVFNYWISNWLFDFFYYLPAIGSIFALIIGLKIEGLTGTIEFTQAFCLVLVLFVTANNSFTYVFSYLFKSADSALWIAMFLNLVFSVIILWASLILRFFPDVDTQLAGYIIDLAFKPWPLYCL